MDKSERIALFLCLVVTCIFSVHYIVAKEILEAGVSPFSLSAWRGLVGGLLILLFTREKFSLIQIKSLLLPILSIAFFGFFLNQMLFMLGLRQTSSLNVAIISNIIPVLTFFMAFLFALESMTMRRLLGLVISFVLICYFLFLDKWEPGHYQLFNFGNVLIFLNVVSACLSLVLAKKLLNRKFPFPILSGLMLLGGGMMMAIFAHSSLTDLYFYSTGGVNAFLLSFFEIIFSTAVVYYLNFYCLKILGPTKVTFFIYLQPVVTAILGFLLDGRRPKLELYIVFAGIAMAGYLVLVEKRKQVSRAENE